MIAVVPFMPFHLNDLIVHEYINFIQSDLDDPAYGEYLDNGLAYTALKDGKVLGCAGLYPTGKYRADAWALLSKDSGRYMLAIVRAMLKELCRSEFRRVQTHVRKDFRQGLKMMKTLGFENETPNGLKNYGDDGCDYYLYARCA